MDEGFVSPLGQDLFEKEQNNLLADLMDIPKKACDRRVWSIISYYLCGLVVKIELVLCRWQTTELVVSRVSSYILLSVVFIFL